MEPERVPHLNGYLQSHDARLAGGCTNRVASHVEFDTHFGVASRANTKFDLAFRARHQLQFKFGASALFGCKEERMQR